MAPKRGRTTTRAARIIIIVIPRIVNSVAPAVDIITNRVTIMREDILLHNMVVVAVDTMDTLRRLVWDVTGIVPLVRRRRLRSMVSHVHMSQ